MNPPTREQLLATVRDPGKTLEQRYAAGQALGWLGDPRIDEQPWVTIAGGVLRHKTSREASIELIELARFELARFPVTVAAYREFIDEGGYDDASHWSPEGWQWREQADVDAPRFWDEEDWLGYMVPNHPVIGAGYFEAEAYACFRDARLPTAAEWERACRGDGEDEFPWGDTWRDDACGHRGYGPRGTKPIGIFPAGVSALGLHDLLGSVWQWTEDPGGDGGDPDRPRIACGAAWNSLPWSIGASNRNAYPPDARFSNVGIRLARDH
jgi:formylglycine-generating enzyme required for sulfatase activity